MSAKHPAAANVSVAARPCCAAAATKHMTIVAVIQVRLPAGE
jgi:hypothetical protein